MQINISEVWELKINPLYFVKRKNIRSIFIEESFFVYFDFTS